MNAYCIRYKLYSWSSSDDSAHVIARTPEKACEALRKAKSRSARNLTILSAEQTHVDVVVAK